MGAEREARKSRRGTIAGAPPRPSITPVFGIAISFWATCAYSYTCARTFEEGACIVGAVVLGALGLVALCVAFAVGGKIAVFVVSGAFFGACLGLSFSATAHAQATLLDGVESPDVEFELLEDVRDNGFSKRALSRIVSGQLPGSCVIAEYDDETLRFGQHVAGRASFGRFDERSAEYGWQRGASCSARVYGETVSSGVFLQGVLSGIRSAAIDSLGSDDKSHALLQALVCGYRETIRDTEIYSSFQTCGLAHLVAVSGAHLVIVTGLFATVLKALRCPKRISVALLVLTMGTYLVIAGMPASAIRATAMSALGLFAFFGRRRASSMNAIGVGALVILCMNPASSVSPSFALSALSTIGIVVFSPLISFLVGKTPLSRIGIVFESVVLTLSASIVSQPYATSLFCQLPLISPIANVVTAPLFPLVCGSGIIASVFQLAHAPFSEMLLAASSICAGILESVVVVLAEVPYACVPFYVETVPALVFTGAGCCALWVIWVGGKHGAKAAICCIVFLALVAMPAFPASQDRIVMLDVGQGDSFLIESRGTSMLVDTGNQDKMLIEELGRLRIVHLDNVLVTHADDDHCGSLDALSRTVQIDRIIMAEGMFCDGDESCRGLVEQAHETAGDVASVSYGDAFAIGNFRAHVVWPHEFADHGGNADSLCVRLDYDGDEDGTVDLVALFTGDAEHEQIGSMLESGDVGDIDILKVGHHGSKNGLTASQAETLKPTIALIGVGKNNRYGHPNDSILEMLEENGCTIYRSDVDGEVRCMLSPESVQVSIVG